MRKSIKTIAGMAVCLLGVLSTSSCSKEEFFGLEGSEYLDKSLKTEIALSQEFTDYFLACYNMVKDLDFNVDTTEMQIQGVVNGIPVYFKTGSYEAGKGLFDNLKKAYPELEKADQVDFDDIQEIALSKNKALKGIVPKKSSKSNNWQGEGESDALAWLKRFSGDDEIDYGEEYLFEDYATGNWFYQAHSMVVDAVAKVIWVSGENSFNMNGGGYIFDNGSAISMVGVGQRWPNIDSRPEMDFLAAPNINLSALELWDIAFRLGPGYYGSRRIHYIFNEEMEYVTFFY